MALLRYMLQDTTEKVEVQASWVEELYYGPVRVVNGYAEVPDNDEFSILILCNRGFEIVDERLPSKKEYRVAQQTVETEESIEEEIIQIPEEFEEGVEAQGVNLKELEKELRKMNREDLNANAGYFGLTEDAENFETRGALIAAILKANRSEED